MSVLKFALGIKTVQALVSVICQLSYLVSEADVNDPTMDAQAKALFALNIMFSLASAMYGIMVWIIKNKVLSAPSTRCMRADHGLSVILSEGVGDRGSDGSRVGVEMVAMYDSVVSTPPINNVDSVDSIVMMNPLHITDDKIQGLRANIDAYLLDIIKLKSSIASLHQQALGDQFRSELG
jgi:hypothetical protein